MPVTITINVSADAGSAEIRTGAGSGTGEGPPPTIRGDVEEHTVEEVVSTTEGPPPRPPEELGLFGFEVTSEVTARMGPPPGEDPEVRESEAETSMEPPEPVPIEELDKPSRATRKKS